MWVPFIAHVHSVFQFLPYLNENIISSGLCHWFSLLWHHVLCSPKGESIGLRSEDQDEDGGSMVLQNTGIQPPQYTVQQPIRPQITRWPRFQTPSNPSTWKMLICTSMNNFWTCWNFMLPHADDRAISQL
jgi:hypothetical protein